MKSAAWTVPVAAALGAACALAGSPSDATNPPASPPGATGALNDAQLAELLRGGVRFRGLPPEGGVPHLWAREYFLKDGNYQSCTHRVVLEGPYTIRRGQVCADVGERLICRIISRGSDGNYYQKFTSGIAYEVPSPIAVEILPIPGSESCYRDK